MRRKLTILLLTLLVFIVSMSLIACKGDEELLATNGQVPVYQGMTISGNNTINNLSPRMAPDENASDVAKYIHGDHTGRDEDIDQETPFEEVPTIDQKTESTLSVVGSGAEIYYANKNQDIYITIKVLNPDSYEIVSFTLNGNKYTSYMFEEGSDLENLILKLNVGEAAGIVDYTIDAIKYIDGTDIKDVIIEGEKTIKAGISADDQTYVNVSNNVTTLNSISFNANLVDLYNLIEKSEGYAKAVLYDGVSIISTKELVAGENSITFDSLVPNKLYQYGIVVLYDNLSGDGIQLNTIYTNAEYTKTIVLFDDISVTQTGITFDYLWEETYENKTITSLSLFLEGEKVEEETLSTALQFSNLLSNVEYEIRASYLNLNQESETISVFFTTAPKATPTVVIDNVVPTQTSIGFGITVTDADQVGSVTTIELYKGEILVEALTDLSVREFTGLLSNNEYTVKVTYTYDLNDEDGVQTSIFEKNYKTLPYIDVIECNVANTSAVSEGDTIFMSVKLDNPHNMTIESVVVNGETYSVTSASTKNRIFVEIIYNGQFAGGDTNLKIDKVNAKLDSTVLTIEPKTDLSDNVFINGKLEVLKIEFVHEDFEPIDWAFPSDTVFILVTLDNPTGYTIDSVNTSITALTKIDNNSWYYATTLSAGWNKESIDNLSYHNEYIDKTLSYSNIEALCYEVVSEEIKYISTPDDLKNMSDGYYYYLTKDIDLSGLEWLGAEFNGVFDGNGYAIKNMSFVGTIKNTDAYLGLFAQGGGVIQNLDIEEAMIITEVTADDGNSYKAYCGGYISFVNRYITIDNSSIDENSIFNLKNTTGDYPSASIGGFIGLVGYNGSGARAIITNCTNGGRVTATTPYSYAGGMIGYIDDAGNPSYAKIMYSINSGDVAATGSADIYVGGIIGCGKGVITNCVNSGDISATSGGLYAWAGGMIGLGEGAITNCINSGRISGYRVGGIIGVGEGRGSIVNCINSGRISGYIVGGLSGYIDEAHKVTIVNSYSSLLTSGIYNGELCTIEQLNSKEFYTEMLGWGEDIWDFSELDIENDKYPKLKH